MRNLRLAIVVTFLFSTQLLASSLPEFPFIGVEGKAESEVAPDIANVRFVLIEFSEKQNEALNVIKQRSSQIIEIVRDFNISDESIISAGIENQIKRHVNRDGGYNQTKILGYELSQSFNIKIQDVSKYSAFVDKLISVGNVGRISPSFDVSNRKEILRALVAKAGKDAKQKADDLANAMGVKIKSVFAINQDESFQNFFARFGLQEQGLSGSTFRADRVSDHGSINMMVPKSIKIEKKISVVYKIK